MSYYVQNSKPRGDSLIHGQPGKPVKTTIPPKDSMKRCAAEVTRAVSGKNPDTNNISPTPATRAERNLPGKPFGQGRHTAK